MPDTPPLSFTSRTRPTKLATAPTRGLPRVSAAISAPTSKSSCCTRTLTSASGHRRKERHFIAVADGMVGVRHFLIDRHAQVLEARQHCPRLAARGEMGTQSAHAGHVLRQLDALGALSHGFAQA